MSRFGFLLLHAGLVYSALVWGATFFMVKDVLAGVHPGALVGWRFLLAAAFLLPLVVRKSKPLRLLKEGAVLAGLLMALYVAQTAGLLYTTASNSGFITGGFILFVPPFMYFYARETPRAGHWLSILLALAGLWLVTGGLSGINRGDALTLIAACAYAAHVFATDSCVRGEADIVLLAFHQFWITGAACLAATAAAGAPLGAATAKAAWVILFLALVPTLSAFFIQMKAQKHVPPMTVSLIFSLEPVFAAIFAWTLGGEAFRGQGALGGLLVAGAIALGSRGGKTETA
ncbi:MAG: DMT family transporter [Elusimicrobia bacterium]|nr:DMT family transporter [Elusimicrobiota bacterium]